MSMIFQLHMKMLLFFEDMRDLLNGIFCVSDMSWQDKLDKSVIAQYLVSSWRKFCEYQVAKERKNNEKTISLL